MPATEEVSSPIGKIARGEVGEPTLVGEVRSRVGPAGRARPIRSRQVSVSEMLGATQREDRNPKLPTVSRARRFLVGMVAAIDKGSLDAGRTAGDSVEGTLPEGAVHRGSPAVPEETEARGSDRRVLRLLDGARSEGVGAGAVPHLGCLLGRYEPLMGQALFAEAFGIRLVNKSPQVPKRVEL